MIFEHIREVEEAIERFLTLHPEERNCYHHRKMVRILKKVRKKFHQIEKTL